MLLTTSRTFHSECTAPITITTTTTTSSGLHGREVRGGWDPTTTMDLQTCSGLQGRTPLASYYMKGVLKVVTSMVTLIAVILWAPMATTSDFVQCRDQRLREGPAVVTRAGAAGGDTAQRYHDQHDHSHTGSGRADPLTTTKTSNLAVQAQSR